MPPVDRTIRLQRSELAVPATSEHFFEKAARSDADAIFIDLEDAVWPQHKNRAREMAVAALNDVDWGDKTMSVRVNSLDTRWAWEDIIAIAKHCPRLDMVLLPKANCASDIQFVETLLRGVEETVGRKSPIGIEALIETASGLSHVDAIAAASPRLEALIFGVGDFSLSIGCSDPLTCGPTALYQVLADPDAKGARPAFWADPWHYALARIATACRTWGLRAIDGPYADVRDDAGYRASAKRGAALGFEGKWALHPAQIGLANEIFSPSPAALQWASRIDRAMKAAPDEGAILVDGKVVDMAHVKMIETIQARQKQIDDSRKGRAK